MPGGLGLHIYPGHQLPVEGHLHMPLIHWLPKNEARRKLIKAYTYLGVEPEWQWNEGQPRGVRAQRYINFSFNSTFYRHYEEVRAVLERHGLRTRFVGMHHPMFKKGVAGRLSRIGPARDLLNWALLNFKTVERAKVKA